MTTPDPKPPCTYCGAPAIARMETGALRSLGKKDWVRLCQRCVKLVQSAKACGCGHA